MRKESNFQWQLELIIRTDISNRLNVSLSDVIDENTICLLYIHLVSDNIIPAMESCVGWINDVKSND